ncbi:hypothetical protein T440DRAFT_491836 [Plenodomus tracheiphilus IPT5]|uniref:Protein kinase domain-containing protein n=1 Tax=Plenodomus tracheiphilus IPT5 TaxID=1408161 RepID=A0A6A7AWY1_9PLEO|nr:hypothetical protein T440DRAFT_491836 [Plenodomus tracheiphilus IPT5]
MALFSVSQSSDASSSSTECSIIVEELSNVPDVPKENTRQRQEKEARDVKAKMMLLVAQAFPNVDMPSPPQIREIGCGSFNKVFEISMGQSLSRDNSADSLTKMMAGLSLVRAPPKPVQYALRVPIDMSTSEEEASNIAKLNFVSSRAKFPVPKIVGYDHSVDNVLGSAYILQERLRGDNLANVWENLNVKQQVSVVSQLAKIIEQIAAITSPAAGDISIENLTFPSDKVIQLTQFPVPSAKAAVSREEYFKATDIPAYNQTPLQYLLEHCQRWHDYESAKGSKCRLALWSQFQVIARSLHRLGFLGDRFHLSHEDLFPLNIMVAVKNSSTIEITGIIDWDLCKFAPKFVALDPPNWAWPELADSLCSASDDDEPLLEVGSHSNLLLETFKKVASPEFFRFATSPECLCANEMFEALAQQLVRKWRSIHSEDADDLDKC